jgi:hypothetical protein
LALALAIASALALAALAIASVGAPADAAEGRVLWSGDAEAPAAQQWGRLYTRPPNCGMTPKEVPGYSQRVRTNPAPVQGNYAYKSTVTDGYNCWHERTELSQAGSTSRQYFAGQENWEAFSVMLSPGFNVNYSGGGHRTLYQHKQVGNVGSGPPMSLNVANGSYRMTTRGPISNRHRDTVGPAVPGRWVKFVVHTKYSATSSGLIELWSDAPGGPGGPLVRVVSRNKPTLFLDGGRPAPIRVNMGLYRESAGTDGTQWVAHDGLTVGTTRAVVEGRAF